jgi:hypothetical protein
MRQRGVRAGWRLGLSALAVAAAGLGAGSGVAAADPPRQGAPGPDAARQVALNLDRIGLAIHKHLMAHDAFPGSAVCDAAGKPLLSWRVAVLPYLGEGALYDEFRRDEPWDSPHNKKLLARMPTVYAVPGDPSAARHETPFRAFAGERAAFPPPRPQKGAVSAGRRLFDIVDGTSNTLAVAEAAGAVPWTKPDELACDPGKPLPRLGGRFRGGFHALFLDGRVRFLPREIDEKTLRAVIDPFDGVPIDPRTLERPGP